MNKVLSSLLFLFSCSVCAEVAYDPCSVYGWPHMASESSILAPGDIVLDAEDVGSEADIPRNFRVVPKSWGVLLAGTGQFSKGGFKVAQKHLMTGFNAQQKDIYVVDLREESHGFINDDAVTWYGGPLGQGLNQPVDVVEKLEQKWLNGVKPGQKIFVYTVKKDKKTSFVKTKRPIETKVESVMSEKEMVEKMGSHYVRIPVTDHYAPESQDIDQFLDFVKTLPPGAVVLFHCRAGRGRTTTFMVLYDILKSPDVSLVDIVKRHADIGGIDLIGSAHKKTSWNRAPAIKREKIVEDFYEYRHAPDGYEKTSWTKWTQKHYPADAAVTQICKVD